MIMCACSDVGAARDENQDALYYYEDNEIPIYIVADGMGGHRNGHFASNLAVSVISEFYHSNYDKLISEKMHIPQFLRESINAANEKIFKAAEEDEEEGSMGTTIVVLLIKDNEAFVGHVGDSRAYIHNGKDLIKVTKDHSLVEALLSSGSITEDEAKVHPQRNLITRAVGTAEEVDVEIKSLDVEKGDYILMSTDGLHGVLQDSYICEKIDKSENNSSMDKLCTEMIDEVNELGGPDNITVLITKIS